MQAQMIYYKLFKNSNLHGLGLPFYIANEDLMREALIKNKQTFINARNLLIQQGFIQFRSGKKGSPSVYRLLDLQKRLSKQLEELGDVEFDDDTENTGTNSTGKRTESVPEIRPKADQKQTESVPKAVHNKAIANANAIANAKAKNNSEPKIKFAEAVSMTQSEHDKLHESLGSDEAVDWCVDKLNNYKLSSGKKYKNDYRAILSWVIGEYQKSEVNGHGQGFRKADGKRQGKYDPEYEQNKWAGETSGWK
jgi:hypothetical protein